MTKNLLLIRTGDKRRFYSNMKNLPHLIEFAKTFKAELFVVEAKDTDILTLEAIPAAICNGNYNCKVQCKVLKKVALKKAQPTKQRVDMIANTIIIRRYIRTTLIEGQPVSLKLLKKKFENLELTDSCLSNHFSQVRKDMVSSGYTFKKLAAGEYCL